MKFHLKEGNKGKGVVIGWQGDHIRQMDHAQATWSGIICRRKSSSYIIYTQFVLIRGQQWLNGEGVGLDETPGRGRAGEMSLSGNTCRLGQKQANGECTDVTITSFYGHQYCQI